MVCFVLVMNEWKNDLLFILILKFIIVYLLWLMELFSVARFFFYFPDQLIIMPIVKFVLKKVIMN